MEKKKIKELIIVITVLIIIILVWGIIGGIQSNSIEVTCDIGFENTLCWKWHTNAIGQIAEGLRDLF